MSMIPVDEQYPTHRPAVVCKLCGGTTGLKPDGEDFVCRLRCDGKVKRPIPSPDRFRTRKEVR